MDEDDEVVAYAVADIWDDNIINAILSIFRTIFVSIVLAASALIFTKDVVYLIIYKLIG